MSKMPVLSLLLRNRCYFLSEPQQHAFRIQSRRSKTLPRIDADQETSSAANQHELF